MASIRTMRKSKFWYACYRDALGQQHQVSTGIEHSPEPKDPNDKKARENLRAKNKREAIRHASHLEEIERGNPTEAQLRKVLADMSQRLRREKLDFPSTEKFLRDWLDNQRVAESTFLRYRKSVESFIKTLESKAELPIENISPEDINRFATSRFKDGLSASTVAIDLKALSSAFNSAYRQGKILSNPVLAADPIEASQEKRLPFKEGEIQRLLAGTKGTDWETVILLAAYAGLRLGDAVNLKWENINLFEGTITFRPGKTSRKKVDLTLPIAPRLQEHLKNCRAQQSKSAFLCPTLSGKTSAGKSGLSMQFTRIMGKTKIDQGGIEAEGEKGRTFNRKTFHSLRHSFISRLEASGVPSDIRMKLAGHTSESVHAGYTHTELETLRKAVGNIT
jgi:integrase